MRGTSLAQRTIDAIKATRAAFGAPGDYGYETKEGRALQGLYDLHNALSALGVPKPAEDAPLEDRLADLLAKAIDTPLLTLPEPGSGGRFSIELRLYSFAPEIADEAAELLEEIGR